MSLYLFHLYVHHVKFINWVVLIFYPLVDVFVFSSMKTEDVKISHDDGVFINFSLKFNQFLYQLYIYIKQLLYKLVNLYITLLVN